MTKRERLLATLNGKPVDRPPVSFYGIGGRKLDPDDQDPFNVYNDPSWRPLIRLAEEETDIIRICPPILTSASPSCQSEYCSTDEYLKDGSRFVRTTINVAGRKLTSLTRQDPEIDTLWTLEHLLKDLDDLDAYLQLPDEFLAMHADASNLIKAEADLGERGIVIQDTADPICIAAGLFDMADYTVIALTEQELFHKLLEKVSRPIYSVIEEAISQSPSRMWRICGPEYAAEPYLPPRLFDEYVVRYTMPIVDLIHGGGGFARIHCHGRLKNILPSIVRMGTDALDPIEPPQQGDVELAYVRKEYGRDLVLMGNLESSDIENMPTLEFEKVVARSLREGTDGEGRGFVLMPSAEPYGRMITAQTMANYETIIRSATSWAM
jgi:uroporphyrinogen-III decarboxylase